MNLHPVSRIAIIAAVTCMLQLTSPRHLSAQTVVPNAAEQIAGAVAPVPEAMREGATVLGYDANNELTTLREGSNELICVADTPGDDRFQAVCYHRSLEPFMARGRELRAEGLSAEENLRIRHEEADAGKLEMPAMPALFYNMAGPIEGFDSATAPISLFAIYTPYATAESTGMPARPARPGGPWIMRPGTASAHIMIIPPGADH